MTKLASAILAAALVLACSACSGDGDDGRAAPSTTSTTSSDKPECVPPGRGIERAGLDALEMVFAYCNGGLPPDASPEPIERVVPNDGAPLRAALTQLFLGLTAQEVDAGYQSAFSSFTAGGLRSVTVKDGIATLDLTRGWESTNNFGTATLSGMVGFQIEATVFQFPEIDGIELQVEGERWCGWESFCEDQPPPLWTREALPAEVQSDPAEQENPHDDVTVQPSIARAGDVVQVSVVGCSAYFADREAIDAGTP